MSEKQDGKTWDTHWRDYDASASRNPAQAYRRKLVMDALRAGQHAKVLDLGCGQGDLLMIARAELPQLEYFGVDGSEEGLRLTAERNPGIGIWLVDLDSEDEPTPSHLSGWADFCICTEVLEHLDEPKYAIRRAHSLLRENGELLVTVPGGPKSAYDLHIGHRRHFRPKELRALLEAEGFEAVHAYGAGFPFFNLYRLAVIMRGEGLISEAASSQMSRLARFTMALFDFLFRFNVDESCFGWQTVAIARKGNRQR